MADGFNPEAIDLAAVWLDVTPRTVRTWLRRGMPHDPDGWPNYAGLVWLSQHASPRVRRKAVELCKWIISHTMPEALSALWQRRRRRRRDP